MPDLASVANGHPAMILKMTTGIDKYVLPNSNILAIIRIKRRKYSKRRRHLITKQFGKQPTYFVRCTICRIQQERDPSRLVTHGIHKTMYFPCIKRLTRLYIFIKFLRCHHLICSSLLYSSSVTGSSHSLEVFSPGTSKAK